MIKLSNNLISNIHRILLNLIKRNKDYNQTHTGSGDNIAGNKIIVQFNPLLKSTPELITILEMRAEEINKKLSICYKYVEVEQYLLEFNLLHVKHIEALKNNNLMLAHEILIKIHEISFNLEKSEFWENHRINHPKVLYSLPEDIFSRGNLICGYIIGIISIHNSKYPSFFSNFEDYRFASKPKHIQSENTKKDIIKIYTLILNNK